MKQENQMALNLVLFLEYLVFLSLNLVTTINSSRTGVIPVARCRSRCLSQFLQDDVNDEECQLSTPCVSCWNVCEDIFSKPDIWKEPCRRKQICQEGCVTACKFIKTVSRTKQMDLSQTFSEIPAVTIEPRMREAVVAWSTPVGNNAVSGSIPEKLVYVLLTRDRYKKSGSAWKQVVQTSSTFAIMDVTVLPYYPEFWLLAVGEMDTQANIRFNASVSHDFPYTEDVIIVPERFEIRINKGATVEYDEESTLKLNITMPVVDGVLQPLVSWTNPDTVPTRGNKLTYTINYYLQNCDCPWPEEHFSKVLFVDTYDQPTVTLQNIAFNAEYLVEIVLKSDKKWHGEVTILTPNCPQTDRMNPAKCLTEVSVTQNVVFKTTTPFPKTTLESLVNDTVALEAGHLKQDYGMFDPSDWNITNAGMEYDETSQKVFVHLKWSLPFNNHSEVSQHIVWNNIRHENHVDAGRLEHVSKTGESNSKTLQLRPFSQYRIYVEAIYIDVSGNQNELRSRVLDVNTNITDKTPQVSVARMTSIGHEKDILNGIILGVTVVSSVIIFGIIIVFIYKKRQSFRDIIITKTTVAKSNSYKSNVGCKVDYSNQTLITSDDWEVDCRQLKFASHIGQGAFGKVVTGYYQDQRVAIKLVRDCAPISYKEDLLAEIALMKRLGSHPNIVSMVGACTLVEPICLVMEYVPYGNLQNFLKKCRLEGELTIQAGRPEINYSIMDEHGGINEGVVTPADLLSFARQVAMAMEYLGEKKYVHRDLAARNVLLGYNKIIKVCDFGLSRDVFNDNQYKKLTNGKLPLKWMAVESLRDRVFTTQSDVWSFGILLWEIVTMGASPYPNIALADLFYLLSNNYRMEKPSNCSDEIYILMRQCWLENPADRPNFTDLRVQLEHLLTRDRNYLELDNINVPLSTPESSSGSPVSDDTKSLLAAQALQPQRKSSKDELTINVSIHDKSVERLLKRKGDFDAHNITIL